MSYTEAIALGLLQALTEFLPVSSSGHLILAQRWFGTSAEIDLFYIVLVHLATMAAILIYFRYDVRVLIAGLLGSVNTSGGVFDRHERRAVWYIILANVPTVVIGLCLARFLIPLVTRVDVVGAMLVVTGSLLWWGRRGVPHHGMNEMRATDALTVGTIQGLAAIPGISRSGATIVGGIMRGLTRELAVRFSLLISVPAIFGATLLESMEVGRVSPTALGPYLAGMVVAATVGYLAIGLVLRLVRQQRFYVFAYYLWPLGVLAIVSQYWPWCLS